MQYKVSKAITGAGFEPGGGWHYRWKITTVILAAMLALMVLCAALLPATSWAQTVAAKAFAPVMASKEPPGAAALRAKYGTDNVTLVQLNTGVLSNAAADTPVTLNLTPSLQLVGVTRETQTLKQGRRLWRGEISGTGTQPKGRAAIIVNGDKITGAIVTPLGETYQIRPVGNGTSAVIKAKFRKREPDRLRYGSGKSNAATQPAGLRAKANGTPVIDVLVAYTPAALAGAGGDIESLIALGISESNTTFPNSGVNASIRLVGTMQMNYTEPDTGDDDADWDQMTEDLTIDSSIAQKRDGVGADIVVLLVDRGGYCGNANAINASADEAFAVVGYDCVTYDYSFIHEIGHLIGGRHDLAHDAKMTPYPYGHGHQEITGSNADTGLPVGWKTIMSYQPEECEQAEEDCLVGLPYWSSPLFSYEGKPTGNAQTEDNARVWNERAAEVAAFRESAVNTYTVSTNAGPNGGIDPTSAQVAEGETQTFTLNPDPNYKVDSVTGCDGTWAGGNSYTTGPVTADCTVTVTFAQADGQPNYTVTASAGPNGSIDPTTAQVAAGQTQTFTLKPNTGYKVDSVSGCGGTWAGGNTYTTGPITADCAVSVSFAKAVDQRVYTVTASAGTGGTITPSGPVSVPTGSPQTFTVTPNAGFRASVGGTCGGTLAGNIYTTNAITADCTVTATFSAAPGYTITVNAIPNNIGTISPSGAVAVNPGATQAFTITPAANRALYYVTGTCGGIYRGNIYTTRAVNADCTVTAVFR